MNNIANYQERHLGDDEKEEISVFSIDGLDTIGLNPNDADPLTVVSAINVYTDSIQQQLTDGSLTLSENDYTFLPLLLGCLLGEQAVKVLDWEWCCLVQEDGRELYSVASKDRSLIMLPAYYIRECLLDPSTDCTVLLALNMLIADRFSDIPEHSYHNVFEHVVRIVPKH
jgi:hypothetical protein